MLDRALSRVGCVPDAPLPTTGGPSRRAGMCSRFGNRADGWPGRVAWHRRAPPTHHPAITPPVVLQEPENANAVTNTAPHRRTQVPRRRTKATFRRTQTPRHRTKAPQRHTKAPPRRTKAPPSRTNGALLRTVPTAPDQRSYRFHPTPSGKNREYIECHRYDTAKKIQLQNKPM